MSETPVAGRTSGVSDAAAYVSTDSGAATNATGTHATATSATGASTAETSDAATRARVDDAEPTSEPFSEESAERFEKPAAEPIVEAPSGEPGELSKETSAVVPIQGTHRKEPRPSFWRRIGLRAVGGGEASTDRLLARLDVIESRMTASELSLSNRIQLLDDRFTEVWEVEEQLSQMNDLRETLEQIAARQLHEDERLRGLSRRMALLSTLIIVAVFAGLAAILAG